MFTDVPRLLARLTGRDRSRKQINGTAFLYAEHRSWRKPCRTTIRIARRRATSSDAGLGHNSAQQEPAVWERWTKKRTFVRALEGTYGELVQELFTQPRVYHSKDWKWKGGPQNYGKKIINPQSVKVAQSIETHIDVYAPGGYGQKHGHMNSAVFFVLKGKGHDVHDGKRHRLGGRRRADRRERLRAPAFQRRSRRRMHRA